MRRPLAGQVGLGIAAGVACDVSFPARVGSWV
jgi:hypothetical protein